jgi:hypothetical protein
MRRQASEKGRNLLDSSRHGVTVKLRTRPRNTGLPHKVVLLATLCQESFFISRQERPASALDWAAGPPGPPQHLGKRPFQAEVGLECRGRFS